MIEKRGGGKNKKTEQRKLEQDRIEKNWIAQGRIEQDRIGQNRVEYNRIEQDIIGQNRM